MKKITKIMLLFATALGFSQPTTSAPTPPARNAVDVLSIYGDSYTNLSGINYNPSWSQMGTVNTAYDPGTGNMCMAYTNFNYQGTAFEATPQNLAAMEYLHVDVWSNANPATSILQVSPINSSAGTGAAEALVTINYTSGSWYSVDIPKSAFTNQNWDSVFQMKFAANGAGSVVPIDIYLDNIYFWKTPQDPANDATLSDLQVDGATVSGFNSAVLTYTVTLPNGTTTIPQITSATTTNASATSQITQASALPGSATVLVTSSNGTVTKTYTVNYVISGPATPAPTPPARPAADVKSIFSDAYAPISTIGYTGDDNTYDNSWCPGTTTLIQIAGDNTHKTTGLGCEGVTFLAGRINATDFTHVHMDVYTDTETLNKSLNIKFSNWNGGSSEANAIEYSVNNSNFLTNPNPGTWISLDIPLDNFSPINNSSRNDLVQFVITSDLGTIYYDNLYLHKNTMGTSSFDSSAMVLQPNNVRAGELVSIPFEVSKVEVYNMGGQLVSKTNQNVIETATFTTGIYLVKATNVDGLSKVSKLIVK